MLFLQSMTLILSATYLDAHALSPQLFCIFFFIFAFAWSVEDCLCTCVFCLLCRPYTGECQAPCRHMHPSLPTPNVLLPPLPVSWAIQQLRAGFSIPEHQMSISEATLCSQSHSQSTVWSAMLMVAGASEPFLTPVCCCITI